MLDTYKHKIHLINILTILYKDTTAATRLGFKGGTAAMLFYKLPRFSVDLDFDFMGEVSKKEAGDMVEHLREILSKQYQVVDFRAKYHTLFLLVSYEKYQRRIKIEINTRKAPNEYQPVNYYGVAIPVLSLGDMIAHKLIALMDRKVTANRDLFDAHFFLSSPHKTEINYRIIETLTGLKPAEFFEKLLKFVTGYKPKSILDGLGELLDEKQKNWVRTRLASELTNLIRMQTDLVSNRL